MGLMRNGAVLGQSTRGKIKTSAFPEADQLEASRGRCASDLQVTPSRKCPVLFSQPC